jgi:ubiquinone/menaquinone biosynthesis C-methylase UbiE
LFCIFAVEEANNIMDEIIDYYNKLAESYDENRFGNSYGRFIDKQERIILTRFIDKNKVVVDLACGTGRLLDFATIGIDASKEMLEVSQKKFFDKTLLLSDAQSLPLEDNSVDTLFSFHFFMHLSEGKMKRILNECNRVLKKNGQLIFDIPSKKRRNLFQHKVENWHGAQSFTKAEVKSLHLDFVYKKMAGIVFLPIHRFPKFSRNFFTKLDLLVGNIFFKEYASYLIVVLEKK